MYALFRPWATPTILIAFGIFCAIYMAGQLAFARTFTTQTLLDGRVAYDSAQVHKFLTEIETFGQQRYLMIARGTDLTFPICYTLWICLFMVWLDLDQKRTWLLLLPLAAGLCDWCENFGIVRMINTLPRELPNGLVTFTLNSTRLKWALLGACTLINGVFLVLRFWKRNG